MPCAFHHHLWGPAEHRGRQPWILSLPPSPYMPLSLDFLLVKWKRKHASHRTMVRRKELGKEFLLKRICLSTALPLGRVSRLCQSMRSELARPFHLHSSHNVSMLIDSGFFWFAENIPCFLNPGVSLEWGWLFLPSVFGHPVAQRHQNGPTDFLENSQCSVSFQLITSSCNKP